MDLGLHLQHLHLIGLNTGSRAPQELLVWRITTGHLSVLQVLLLHQIFGDELSGLPKDPLPPPRIDPQHTEEFPDLFPGGAVTLHEDNAQVMSQEPTCVADGHWT